MKRWNLTKKRFAGVLAVVVAATSIPVSMGLKSVNASSEIPFGDVTFSFGVVSDLHLHQSSVELSSSVRNKVQRYANTVATLNQMATGNGGLDALLLAGDYMDIGTADQAKTFTAATREILDALDVKNGKTAGTTKFVMTYGNHETEAGGPSQHITYAQWEELLNTYQLLDSSIEYSSETDKTEGAYKITVTKDNKEYVFYSLETTSYEDNMFLTSALEWLRKDLAEVTSQNPNAYVYLSCHGLVQGSDVYGTDPDFAYTDWGSTHLDVKTGTTLEGKSTSSDLYGVLKDFPQVVHFSGHTHFTNVLESTIMSNTYTAISVAAMNEGVPGSGSDPYIDARDTADKGYAMLVEVDKQGRQRITRLEIDDTKLVQATITYTEDAEDLSDTYDDVSDVAASIVFPETSDITPSTLAPWVMDTPNAGGTHLATYSKAGRAKTPVFAEGATLNLTNIELAADGTASFDVTFPTAACDNYIIRYELTLYDQDGKEFDKAWMYGNWTKSHRGEAQGLERSYEFSYKADKLSRVSGIYATLVAIDEFGGTSTPLKFGSRYELQRLTPILSNGGFENGLNGWSDYDSDVMATDSTTYQNGANSLAITRQDTKAESIRTEISSISPETEYTLSYAVNTGASAAVKAIVYEYSFHNKIVKKHECAAYGPTAVDAWEEGKITFTTSADADKLGIVLVADGAAGTIYVDDVLLVANGIETTQVHCDDYNGNGTINVADLVRMKRVFEKDEAVTLAAEKYADRDGNGAFEAADIAGFREKLVGIEDDFTGVIATENAVGAKLEPVITEEPETITGTKVTVTETSGNVKLSTTNTVSNSSMLYMVTAEDYTTEHFEITTNVTANTSPNLIIGARLKDSAGYMPSIEGGKSGVFIRLHGNFFQVTGLQGGGTAKSYNYVNNDTWLQGTCTFSIDVTGVGENTILKFVVKQEGVELCNKTYNFTSVTGGNMNNESGKFVVWSGQQEREFSYYIGEPKVEEPKDIAYLTTGGDYTDQTFVFTTEIDYSNETPLTIGARMEDVTNTPKAAQGLTAALQEGQVVLSAKGWSDTISADFALTEGETYLLSAKVTDNEDSTKTFTLVAHQDSQVVATATCELDATYATAIPASGAFAVWSADEAHDVMYQIVQDNEQAVVIPKEAEDGMAILAATSGTQEASNQAYLFVDGDYTTETFAFTMDTGDATGNFAYIGLHKKAGHPTYFAQDGCHLLLKDWGIAAYTDLGGTWREEVTSQYTAPNGTRVTLSSGTYTIKVRMEGNAIHLTIMKDGVVWSNDKITFAGTVENPSGDYASGASYTVPKSGGFSVWRPYNQTGDLEIAYQMPYMTDTTSVQVDDDGDGGSALLTTKAANNTTKSAYFMLADKYTTEHFEVTTMLSDATNANLQIGARMAGVSRDTSANNGVIVNVAKDKFTVLQNGTQIGDATSWTTALNARTNYTFRVSISSTTLTIKVLQGSTVVNESTVTLSDSPASSGYFAVWSQDPYRQIEYRLLLAGTNSLIITEPNATGSVLLKRTYTDSWNKAYLALEDDYTTETFEVTTSSVYLDSTQLYVGLRCSGTHVTDGQMEGIYVGLAGNFFSISGKTNGISWSEASQNYKNMNGNIENLVEGVEYTFSFSLSAENVLTISVKQEGKVVRTNTVILDGIDKNNVSYTLPQAGGLRVRTVTPEYIFTYKISE